jgi:hypothetical protein
MLLKLLDRSDIIRYGKTVLEIPNHIAQNLINAKRAIEFVGNEQQVGKAMTGPTKDKMIWASPEKKAFEGSVTANDALFPGTNDPLFPEHIIGRS